MALQLLSLSPPPPTSPPRFSSPSTLVPVHFPSLFHLIQALRTCSAHSLFAGGETEARGKDSSWYLPQQIDMWVCGMMDRRSPGLNPGSGGPQLLSLSFLPLCSLSRSFPVSPPCGAPGSPSPGSPPHLLPHSNRGPHAHPRGLTLPNATAQAWRWAGGSGQWMMSVMGRERGQRTEKHTAGSWLPVPPSLQPLLSGARDTVSHQTVTGPQHLPYE